MEGARWRSLAVSLLPGVLLLAVSWALLRRVDDALLNHDVELYRIYGAEIVDGLLPYRDFPVEYPPGALPIFWITALAPAAREETVFELLMGVCAVVALASVTFTLLQVGASPRRVRAAAAFIGLAVLALGPVVLNRYDLWPVALVALALAALVAGRERVGLGVLAVATAAKIYPLVLLPAVFLYTRERRGPRQAWIALSVFAGVLAATFLPFVVLAPDGLFDSLERQLTRPLQIESLGGAFLLAAGELGVYSPRIVHEAGSWSLSGGLPDALSTGLTVALAVSLLGVWTTFARAPQSRERLLTASAASVVAYVAFGKVLSPQYLIWLLPLVPLVAGRTGLAAAGLLAAASIATHVYFPSRYVDVLEGEPVVWVLVFRDVLLVALLAALVAPLLRRQPLNEVSVDRAGTHPPP